MRPCTLIVLAAGEGKRMRSARPKVLHDLLGRTLLGHVLAAAGPLGADRVLVVVGAGADEVRAHLAETAPAALPVLQAEQRGTGHAVRTALEGEDAAGTVLVLNGDVPLIRPATLAALVDAHTSGGAAATVLTAHAADPTGLGRIIRDPGGGNAVLAIVEERDATPEQRLLREVNAGAFAFDGAMLANALDKLSADNDQGEEYLTDVVSLLVAGGHTVGALLAPDPEETLGCNDRADLANLRARLRARVNNAWMRDGVTMLDPDSTWVDVTVQLDRDVTLHPNTHLIGSTTVGEGAEVGPDSTLMDTEVGPAARIIRAHSVGAVVGRDCRIGPYAYLRPGTVLGPGVKIGTYVETKNAEIGAGTKVPHLTYVGDATIGEHTNIGAANVFVNYDGVTKHRTIVGDHVKTGSDTMLVAPVELGDGAYTGAGTVVRYNVPPGALAVSGGPQRNVEGWVESRRPDSPSARAAQRARAEQRETHGEGEGEPTIDGQHRRGEP